MKHREAPVEDLRSKSGGCMEVSKEARIMTNPDSLFFTEAQASPCPLIVTSWENPGGESREWRGKQWGCRSEYPHLPAVCAAAAAVFSMVLFEPGNRRKVPSSAPDEKSGCLVATVLEGETFGGPG